MSTKVSGLCYSRRQRGNELESEGGEEKEEEKESLEKESEREFRPRVKLRTTARVLAAGEHGVGQSSAPTTKLAGDKEAHS